MDASVVIPNHDGERWLPGVLGSLAVQTRAPAEVIVVDDASADGSLALLAREHPHVRVIALRANRGFAVAVAERILVLLVPRALGGGRVGRNQRRGRYEAGAEDDEGKQGQAAHGGEG